MDTYPLESWARVGALLRARRGELGSLNREDFARAAGMKSPRPMYDLEESKRTNFRPETIAQFETAYQLRPGAIERALMGGDLDRLPAEPVEPSDLEVIDHPVGSGHMLIAVPSDLPEKEREVFRQWAERKAQDLNRLRMED